MMQDSSKFVDLLYGIEWEEGLSTDMTQVVESYLAKGKEDQTGITGEGLLLENPESEYQTPPPLILYNSNLII